MEKDYYIISRRIRILEGD